MSRLRRSILRSMFVLVAAGMLVALAIVVANDAPLVGGLAGALVLLILAYLTHRIVAPIRQRAELARSEETQRRNQSLAIRARANEDFARAADERAQRIQLLEVSRRAGQADIATSVLHNVGNVLNSVKISAALILQGLRTSELTTVRGIADLLAKHADDLGKFLTEDAKGKQIPEFLTQLAEALETEQAKLVGRAYSIQDGLDHIKRIIQAQSKFTRAKGVVEMISPSEIADAALEIAKSSYGKRGIEVVREYSAVDPVPTDRHLALQIVLNLIENARDAVSKASEKRVRVSTHLNGNNSVRITVHDSGIGIAPDKGSEVFEQGFTTKDLGHGIGLHFCGNAAKQLGGALTWHSDGLGTGATFTLELPREGPPNGRSHATQIDRSNT